MLRDLCQKIQQSVGSDYVLPGCQIMKGVKMCISKVVILWYNFNWHQNIK